MIDTSQFTDKKAVYLTLGCRLNFSETSAIGKTLSDAGFRKVRAGEQADICVINTCSVTDIADKKCRQAIHKMVRNHPDAFVVVTGCYAQLKPEEIAGIEGVDLVLGANEKFDVLNFIEDLHKKGRGEVHSTAIDDVKAFHPSVSHDDRTRFFLKVQDGCDYRCSYCTIPFARGKSRNGTIADTVKIAEQAVAEGAKEIVLSGINIGDFGKSTGETFFELVKALDNVKGVERYRISSIEPNLITNEIIDFAAKSAHFVPHYHIPLQSGNNEILGLMRRRYKRELFAERIEEIKHVMPDAFIGVDVIVGVRGETDDHFEDAYRFIESLPISQLHVFTYSERPGTKALEIEYTVPMQVRKQRSERLHELSERKTRAFYESQIGKSAKVLWESAKKGEWMHGFTENYVRVSAPYDKSKINTIEEVVLKGFHIENEASLPALSTRESAGLL
ncbi:MAG: putative Fe-S oxidoreductase [Bacteroidetes bacterium]|nr:putative Fe-S oxidoreductase [Bacteroidota bacterium]